MRPHVLLLPLLGSVVALLGLELGVRLWFHPHGPDRASDTSYVARQPRWVPHPFLPYAGPRSAHVTTVNDDGSHESIQTNAYGFRTGEFPETPNPDDFVVLCLGESTTYGYRTSDNASTWPALLEAQLQEAFPGHRIRVFNLGMDLASSAFSVVNLALIGVHLEPDLVIVYHGCNDANVANVGGYRWDHSHVYRDLDAGETLGIQARLPRWMLQSQLLLLVTGAIDRVQGRDSLQAAATLPLSPAADPEGNLQKLLRNLKTLHALASSAGAEILFATFQFRDASIPLSVRYNEALRELFRRRSWNWVDQDRQLPDGDAHLQVDPCHFTQKGRNDLATNFFAAIMAFGLGPAELAANEPGGDSRMP